MTATPASRSPDLWVNDAHEGVEKDAAYWASIEAEAFRSLAEQGVRAEDAFENDPARRERYIAHLADAAR